MSTHLANILVVDDQPDNLRVLSQILHLQGFQVRQAINGQIALKTIRVSQPDLILLDIRMPRMDGYMVCEILKASPQTRDIPIIFLSALTDTAEKVKAFEVGGVDYITKPFEAREVLARIDHQLKLRQQQQQLVHLLQQVQTLNNSLEQQVQQQTVQLEQALSYERTLKAISDRVRDSLDQSDILHTTVAELTRVLDAQCCDTVLIKPNHGIETICIQSPDQAFTNTYDSASLLAELPEVNEQLRQGLTFAFCRSPVNGQDPYSAILGCPIRDDRAWLGTLWLFKSLTSHFSDLEVRLIEQVANQCAIALRQARLYQEAQAQIGELHQLNQLKDDFLSTVSHELRTPVANMRMVLQLLTNPSPTGPTLLDQMASSQPDSERIMRYFSILQTECEREISLIQDLLDLQHLVAGNHPLELVSIDLLQWLLHLLEPYDLRTQTQEQQLIVQLSAIERPIITDLSCLNRIIIELLDNACKYTPAHHRITVTTESSATHWVIRICNEGTEIPPEEQTRIFDKFYRIPNPDPWKYSGTGLGLALAKQLTHHLGGAIHVTSQNALTCFTLSFPYSM